MTTKYFGEKFDATKVDGNIYIVTKVYVPPSVRKDKSTTLFFNLEKNTMKEISYNDKMDIGTVGYIDADKTHVTTNINGHSINKNNKYYHFRLNRKVTDEDIKNIKQNKMPGFRFSWQYNKEVELWTKFKPDNNQFTRLAIFSIVI